MNRDIKKAIDEMDEEDDEPVVKSTIAHAERFADKLFKSGVVKPIMSVRSGMIYFQWSAPGSCGMVSVNKNGKAVFSYATKTNGGNGLNWMLGDKIPDEFFNAMKEMRRDNEAAQRSRC